MVNRKRNRNAWAGLVSAEIFGRNASRPVCPLPFRLITPTKWPNGGPWASGSAEVAVKDDGIAAGVN